MTDSRVDMILISIGCVNCGDCDVYTQDKKWKKDIAQAKSALRKLLISEAEKLPSFNLGKPDTEYRICKVDDVKKRIGELLSTQP